MRTLEEAISLAAAAHSGQTDRGGAPYILHLLRVMMQQETLEARIVGVLHDLVEDTEYTFYALRNRGYSQQVIVALQAVTRRDGEPYEAFARRAGQHPIGRQVKRADLEDNLNAQRLPAMNQADAERMRKYHAARALLVEMSRT